nr:MAG: ORF1 [Torque teno midi virus]
MPFWWQRRKRWFWRRPLNQTKRRRKRKRRYTRRPFYKYKRRRTFGRRRRRRRRKKVRRKLQKLTLKVWQPEKIKKCKIKGLQLFLMGSEGKQFACFTDDKDNWTPARNPGGGGFTLERYTLQYLYEDHKAGNNIWTTSNIGLDLCRYTGCRFSFFRSPNTDFIVSYQLQGPFDLDKFSYADVHPKNQLLQKHHIIIPSHKTKPFGRNTVSLKIKPPKLLTTKWFFQESFSDATLVVLKIAAINVNYPYLSPTGTNLLVTCLSINQQFYTRKNWGDASQRKYNPQGNLSATLNIKTSETQTAYTTVTVKESTYKESIDIKTGWFQSKLLQAIDIQGQNVLPISAFRYNPEIDDGKGNAVWLSSVLKIDYNKPSADKDLIIEGRPMWELLYGFFNWVQKIKKDPQFLRSYIVVLQSRYFYPFKDIGTQNYHIPIDLSFVQGKGPYKEKPTLKQQELWFPTLENQLESINAIVSCGPYIPKYSNERESNWQLHGRYSFYFKWGGSAPQDQLVADPENQGTYITPDSIKKALQIINPEKQVPAGVLHSWDYRRGLITKTALKRMLQDAATDTDFQTDADAYHPPQKKKKGKALPLKQQEEEEIQSCLLSLCEENTCQESQGPENLQTLINQQQQQQHKLKINLLKLIADLKRKQRIIQLQTGMLE